MLLTHTRALNYIRLGLGLGLALAAAWACLDWAGMDPATRALYPVVVGSATTHDVAFLGCVGVAAVLLAPELRRAR